MLVCAAVNTIWYKTYQQSTLQIIVSPWFDVFRLTAIVRDHITLHERFLKNIRAGVHAPTKSVSVQAAISVVLIFHVSLWPRSSRGRQDKVIVTTTDMSATPSINTAAQCAEQVRARLPCDVRCFVASLEKIVACSFVRLCNQSL